MKNINSYTFNSKVLNQSGVILVMVMVLTVILAIIAAAILGFGLWAYEQATFYEDYNQALYSAEAGINYAIANNQTSVWLGPYSSPSTGIISNASFTITTGLQVYTGDTIQLVSTGTVVRLTNRVRSISVEVVIRDPWKHFIWQGCDDVPNGSDQTGYPNPYNSTTNGPTYDAGTIGLVTLDANGKWLPYWEKLTTQIIHNAIYLGKDTTIINYSLTTAGPVLQYSTTGFTTNGTDIDAAIPAGIKTAARLGGLEMTTVNDSTFELFGNYTGLIYVQGTLELDKSGSNNLNVYGHVYAVGGDIIIGHQDKLTVHQATAQSPLSAIVPLTDITGNKYQSYVTIAAIDTSASQFCDDTTNSGMGNIEQLTGNADLQMGDIGTPNYPGGVLLCSNAYLKNGTGTEINGVIMLMNNNINGYPSGSYYFDPTVHASDAPILGVDVSLLTGFNVAAGTWRELPIDWAL